MGKRRDKEEEKEKKKKKSRKACCEKEGMKRGTWTPEEDKILVDFITQNGHGTWRNLPQLAGLKRCGKSCRLRWNNYLRPDIIRGPFSPDEEKTIIHLQGILGNKWAAIATNLPGRTDNDVKNFWNSHLRKRLNIKGFDQLSSSSKSADTKCNALFSGSSSKCEGDYFIRLWNSEVGESFRNINESVSEWGGDGAASHSSASQASSFLTKVESGFRPTNLSEPEPEPEPLKGDEMLHDQKMDIFNCKKETEDVVAYSESSKSYEELDESSEAMLKLLLDFPVGDDDYMDFLQVPNDNVSTDIQH